MGTYVVFSQVESTETDDLNTALRAAYDESKITKSPVTVWRDGGSGAQCTATATVNVQ